MKTKVNTAEGDLEVETLVIDSSDVQILKSLNDLENYVHFKRFSKIIDLEIRKKEKVLTDEREPIEIYRLQGEIRGLRKSINIKNFKKTYIAKIENDVKK